MEKLCGICGEDCSDRARVKDSRGRYYCEACAMERAKQPASAGAEEEADPYDIDDGLLPAAVLDRARTTTQCPGCMRSMAPGARVCVSCGYNVELGIQSSTMVERSRGKGGGRVHQCPECGYDLTGLRSGVCPECGSRVTKSKRERMDKELRSQVLHEEYLKPAVWFGIGFVVVAVVLAIKGELLGFVGYAIVLGFQLPLMLLGLWLCQKTFLGDVGTPLLNLVRLAGALALGNAVDEIIPISFLLITPGLIVFWAVLMDLFEIDLGDAIITGIVMGIVKIAGALGAVYVLVTHFGLTL